MSILIPQISTYYGKIKLKFPFTLARPHTILSVVREMIRIKKGIKRYNFRIKSEEYKMSVVFSTRFTKYVMLQVPAMSIIT